MERSIQTLTLLCTVCVVLCVAQQTGGTDKRLPSPDGKYGVARIGYDWVDKSRPEPLSKVPGANREIMVFVWYPVDRSRKKILPSTCRAWRVSRKAQRVKA